MRDTDYIFKIVIYNNIYWYLVIRQIPWLSYIYLKKQMCSDKKEKKVYIKIFRVYKKFFNDILLKGFLKGYFSNNVENYL